MSNGHRGRLVLQEVPTGEIEKRVVMLLSQFAKSASSEELIAKVRNTPYTLSKNLPSEKALILLEALQRLGATAAFVPHPSKQPPAQEITPIDGPLHFTFDSLPLEEEKPPIALPKPAKNGTRRLVMLLVILLLLGSMGFLAWQLWPLLGEKILELWSSLKQLF